MLSEWAEVHVEPSGPDTRLSRLGSKWSRVSLGLGRVKSARVQVDLKGVKM